MEYVLDERRQQKEIKSKFPFYCHQLSWLRKDLPGFILARKSVLWAHSCNVICRSFIFPGNICGSLLRIISSTTNIIHKKHSSLKMSGGWFQITQWSAKVPMAWMFYTGACITSCFKITVSVIPSTTILITTDVY